MDDTTHFDSRVYDALDRYKRLNGTDYYMNIIQPLLSILKENFKDDAIRRIAFYNDAAKIRLDFLEKEFIIDWDYEDTPPVFVAPMEEETLMIKDGTLEELSKIIKSYYNHQYRYILYNHKENKHDKKYNVSVLSWVLVYIISAYKHSTYNKIDDKSKRKTI